MSASIPSSVPRISDVTMSCEASLRVWQWLSYEGQVARMWSRVWIGSPHGQDRSSVGTCVKVWPLRHWMRRTGCERCG